MLLVEKLPINPRLAATFAACVSGILGTVNISLGLIVSLNSFAGYFLGITAFIFYGIVSVGICLLVAHLCLMPFFTWSSRRWRRGPIILIGATILLFIPVKLFIHFHPTLELEPNDSLLLFPYFLNLGVFFCLFVYRKKKQLTMLAVAAILVPIISVYSISVREYAVTLQRLYPELKNRVSQVRISETIGDGAYLYRFKIEEQNLIPLIRERNLDQTNAEVCGKVLYEEGGYWVGWSSIQLKDSACYDSEFSDFYLFYNPVSKIAYIVNINT